MIFYGVYDKVAREFGGFFPAKTDEDAVRQVDISFSQSAEKNKYFSSADYALYRIFNCNELDISLTLKKIKDYSEVEL